MDSVQSYVQVYNRGNCHVEAASIVFIHNKWAGLSKDIDDAVPLSKLGSKSEVNGHDLYWACSTGAALSGLSHSGDRREIGNSSADDNGKPVRATNTEDSAEQQAPQYGEAHIRGMGAFKADGCGDLAQ